MDKFKSKIATKISSIVNLESNEIESYIEKPKENANGDYAFPCFRLAKELKKAPPIIANEISEKIDIKDSDIEKVEVVGGYINFFISKEEIAKEVLANMELQKLEMEKL